MDAFWNNSEIDFKIFLSLLLDIGTTSEINREMLKDFRFEVALRYEVGYERGSRARDEIRGMKSDFTESDLIIGARVQLKTHDSTLRNANVISTSSWT